MKIIGMMNIKYGIILVLYLSISLVKGIGCAEEASYPLRVEIINKYQATTHRKIPLLLYVLL